MKQCYRTDPEVGSERYSITKRTPPFSLGVLPHLLGSLCPPWDKRRLSMPEIGEKERNYLFKSYTNLEQWLNVFIKILKFFWIPINSHSPSFFPLPSLGYRISGKEVEVRDSGSRQPCCRHRVPTLPKLRGSLPLFPQNLVVFSLVWLLCLGLNPSTSLPL